VDLVKILVGLGVGLLDESLAEHTIGTVKTQDVARVGLFVAGLAVDFLGRGAVKDIGETLEVATAPLVVKTAYTYIKERAKTYSRAVAYAPEVRVVPRPGGSISSY